MQSKAKTVNLLEDHEAFFPISFHNSTLHFLRVNFLDEANRWDTFSMLLAITFMSEENLHLLKIL